MKSTSAAGGRGTRYVDSVDGTVQVVFEAGGPAQADPYIKAGP
ncbi:hypothetical protein GCM10010172_39410 [Paractinoplanes ferrugineus]|uniref:Uncharacterized protein n=1 Tax=Paractinoplanes ferrugineus TaxID=113564 RepID=A0A919J3I2_9ACTN|nr:hypothetical protein [Actinoplanes ferrugineus]GIE12717.1 hypothetical protein Afe05nite_45570 [Actinoplanes ferrugineus]